MTSLAHRGGTNASTISRNKAFSLRYAAWRLGRMSRQPTGAIVVPCRHQQHEAQAKKPGMMLTDTPFLRHRILGAAFVGVTAVAKQIQDAIGWRRQGDQEILRQPADEQMHVPIGGFEHAAKAPGGDRGGCHQAISSNVLRPGCTACMKMSQQKMSRWRPRHTVGMPRKDQGHEARQIGEGHHAQRHP